MFSGTSISVLLATAVFVAPMRLPAASCILSNAPSEKACLPGCCANKACCKTSHKNTTPPAQPFAKSGSDQNVVAIPSTVSAIALIQAAADSSVFSSAECTAHSPPPLALICIRLI
jgi:hypothetical protein